MSIMREFPHYEERQAKQEYLDEMVRKAEEIIWSWENHGIMMGSTNYLALLRNSIVVLNQCFQSLIQRPWYPLPHLCREGQVGGKVNRKA